MRLRCKTLQGVNENSYSKEKRGQMTITGNGKERQNIAIDVAFKSLRIVGDREV